MKPLGRGLQDQLDGQLVRAYRGFFVDPARVRRGPKRRLSRRSRHTDIARVFLPSHYPVTRQLMGQKLCVPALSTPCQRSGGIHAHGNFPLRPLAVVRIGLFRSYRQADDGISRRSARRIAPDNPCLSTIKLAKLFLPDGDHPEVHRNRLWMVQKADWQATWRGR